MSFFNYFSDSERGGASQATDLKNRAFAVVHPWLRRLRVHPDALSYAGLALLVGVVIWFKAHPFRAAALLVLYVINDGLDGSYARYLKRPTQAGAFTDIVADQLGMVVMTLGFIQYRMVDGEVGAYYIMIYLLMITFSVLQNALMIPMQYILRSKYILYLIYILWAFARINLAPYLLPVFCLVMTVSVAQSYRRLKRGLSWKYDLANLLVLDQKIRVGGGSPPKFIPVLKQVLPGIVIAVVLVAGVWPQMLAMVERPALVPEWRSRELPIGAEEEPRAVASYGDGWLVSTFHPQTRFAHVYYLVEPGLTVRGEFRVPWAVHPDHGVCAEGNHLYLADRLSRRVYDLNLEDSFRRKLAAVDGSFDTTLDAPISCAMIDYQGARRMLISEYMNRYQTIVVDPGRALAAGTARGAVLRWYRNAGFSRGLTASGPTVLEMNSSLWRDVIYAVDLDRALGRKYLRAGIISTLAAPRWRCRNLALREATLALVDGRRPLLYTAPLPAELLPAP
jgi:phosphatidylglycerophosphate synthase